MEFLVFNNRNLSIVLKRIYDRNKKYRITFYNYICIFKVALNIFFILIYSCIFINFFDLQNIFQLYIFVLLIYLTSLKRLHKNFLPRCNNTGNASEDVTHITEVTLRALNTTRSHNLQRILPVMHRVVVHELCLVWQRTHNRNPLKRKEFYVETFGPGLPRRAHNAID